MPSKAFLQQLQRIFAHFRRNGGANRPPCCLQVELIDEDDLSNWYVQLAYKRPRRDHERAEQDADTSVTPPYQCSEGSPGMEEDLIVNLRLQFVEADESSDDKAPRASAGSSTSSPSTRSTSRMPLVFVISPRVVAPFIHFGAICALELMSEGSWHPSPLNMELLIISLHETLNPFSRGSSVQILADGVGHGAVVGAVAADGGGNHNDDHDDGAGEMNALLHAAVRVAEEDYTNSNTSLAGVSRYSAQEHQDGIRHIRRAHPHLFRALNRGNYPNTHGTEGDVTNSDTTGLNADLVSERWGSDGGGGAGGFSDDSDHEGSGDADEDPIEGHAHTVKESGSKRSHSNTSGCFQMRTAEAVHRFITDSCTSYLSRSSLMSVSANGVTMPKRRSYKGVVDLSAVAADLDQCMDTRSLHSHVGPEVPEQQCQSGSSTCLSPSSSPAQAPSLVVNTPSTLCRWRAVPQCRRCPETSLPGTHHALTLSVPYVFSRERGDGVSITLTGVHTTDAAPIAASVSRQSTSSSQSSPLPTRPVAFVLRQAVTLPASGAKSTRTAATARKPANQQSHLPSSLKTVGACMIRAGCSLTLRNLDLYGHLQVRGKLTLVNCTLIGSIVTEGTGRVSLRGCDIGVAVQAALLDPAVPMPSSPQLSLFPNLTATAADAMDATQEREATAVASAAHSLQTNRLEGLLVLDDSLVELLDGTVVARAVPYFSPEFSTPIDGEEEHKDSINNDSNERGSEKGRRAHGNERGREKLESAESRRRGASDGKRAEETAGSRRSLLRRRRPRFSLRHGKTMTEQEQERLPLLRALIIVSNHARLRIENSVVSPRHAVHCDHTIFAENDAAVDLFNAVVAAGERSAVTLQGCRGHCEHVLITSTDALQHACHLALHTSAGEYGNGGACEKGGDSFTAEIPMDVATSPSPPRAPSISQSRKATGINVELGGVVTARYCVAEYVYFGFSAIAQSVASFHGCHAQKVVNGFTIDASTANLGRCSTVAAQVGVYVLHKAKCTILCDEDGGEDGDIVIATARATAKDGTNGLSADAADTRVAPGKATHSSTRRARLGFGARCSLVADLAVYEGQTDSASPSSTAATARADALDTLLRACRGSWPTSAGAADPPAALSDRLHFSLVAGDTVVTDTAGAAVRGTTHVPLCTSHALSILQRVVNAATAAEGHILLHAFCLFLGGAFGVEVRDAVVDVTGAMFIGPRECGVMAVAGSAVTLQECILWGESAMVREPLTGQAHTSGVEEIRGQPRYHNNDGIGRANRAAPVATNNSDDGNVDSRRNSADSTSNPPTPLRETQACGLSIRDRSSIHAEDCLMMACSHGLLLSTGSCAVLTSCMAAMCGYGYVAAGCHGASDGDHSDNSNGSGVTKLTARHCGASTRATAVLAMGGAVVHLRGTPHLVSDENDEKHMDEGNHSGDNNACRDRSDGDEGHQPTVGRRRRPQRICGRRFTSVYRGGSCAIECRSSRLAAVGVRILRGDRFGFHITDKSVATIASSFVDMSSADAAHVLYGHHRHGRSGGRGDGGSIRQQRNSGASRSNGDHHIQDAKTTEAASATSNENPRSAAPDLTDSGVHNNDAVDEVDENNSDDHDGISTATAEDTESITTCAVRVIAGSRCTVSEVEIRFVACALMASGPESSLHAHRCRIRHVATGFAIEEGASATLSRCLCHATHAVTLGSNARGTIAHGRYTAREVGFDNMGGLLRIVGHVKVTGAAVAGVRLSEEAHLEVTDEGGPETDDEGPTAGPTTKRAAEKDGIDPDDRSGRHRDNEKSDAGYGPAHLDVRLAAPPPPLHRLPSPPPPSPSYNSDVDTQLVSETSEGRRPAYPVCLLAQGCSTATIHRGTFTSAATLTSLVVDHDDNTKLPQQQQQQQSLYFSNAPVGPGYGVRVGGEAKVTLRLCVISGCREACVRVGAGSRIFLYRCALYGRRVGFTNQTNAIAAGGVGTPASVGSALPGKSTREATPSTVPTVVTTPPSPSLDTGSGYALEIHRGGVCHVSGSLRGSTDGRSSSAHDVVTKSSSSSSHSISTTGLGRITRTQSRRRMWFRSLWRGAMLQRRLYSLYRVCHNWVVASLVPALVRRVPLLHRLLLALVAPEPDSKAGGGNSNGCGGVALSFEEEEEEAPWHPRRSSKKALRFMAWWKELHGHHGDRLTRHHKQSSEEYATASGSMCHAIAHQDDALAPIQGRCLVTGTCIVDRVAFSYDTSSHYAAESATATVSQATGETKDTHATPSWPPILIDVAKGGSLSASRSVVRLAVPPSPFLTEESALPVIFARHAGTSVDLEACLVVPVTSFAQRSYATQRITPTSSSGIAAAAAMAPVETHPPRCLLRLGAGATCHVAFLTSALPSHRAPWPFPSPPSVAITDPTIETAMVAATEEIADVFTASYCPLVMHVSPSAQLSLDTCQLHAVRFLSSESSSAAASAHVAVHAMFSRFSSHRDDALPREGVFVESCAFERA